MSSAKILALFLADGERPRYGLEISRETGVRPNALYPALTRLEEWGWLNSEWEDADPSALGRPARRLYRLTRLGSIRAWEELQPLYERLREAEPGWGHA